MLSGEDWARHFRDFEHSAFRLETRPHYLVEDEREEFAAFLRGSVPPDEYHYPWLDTVATARAAGKTMQRVHVVTPPLSDYLRYEFTWGYVYNVRAGEDIRILDRSRTPAADLGDEDFWLFDDRFAVRMLYGPDGSQRGREPVASDQLERYRRIRDLALRDAVPFIGYWPPQARR